MRTVPAYQLTRLFLGATSRGARTRCLLSADLGDGPRLASITVDDRLADLGVMVVRILRLAEAADELDALAQLAFWDPLTGLANRALFGEHLRNELERGRRSGTHPAGLSADVDKLKRINDELGHRAGLCGDEVTITTSVGWAHGDGRRPRGRRSDAAAPGGHVHVWREEVRRVGLTQPALPTA